MLSPTFVAFTALVLAAVVRASPTAVVGPAKRFAPSAANTCYLTCPSIDGAAGVDMGETGIIDTSSTTLRSGWAPAAGGALIAESYHDGGMSRRMLSGGHYWTYLPGDKLMTNDGCVAACADSGFMIAGTQAASECYCGNQLEQGVTLTSFSAFTPVACAGNAQQTCGGDWSNSLFYDTTRLNPDLSPKTLTRRAAVAYTICSYPGSVQCLYSSSGGVLAASQPASCPPSAVSQGSCGATGSVKRSFGRALTPLERKVKSRQWSPAKGRALEARRLEAAAGPAWR